MIMTGNRMLLLSDMHEISICLPYLINDSRSVVWLLRKPVFDNSLMDGQDSPCWEDISSLLGVLGASHVDHLSQKQGNVATQNPSACVAFLSKSYSPLEYVKSQKACILIEFSLLFRCPSSTGFLAVRFLPAATIVLLLKEMWKEVESN